MNRYVLSTLAALAVVVAFAMAAPDVQADHQTYGCGSPDYGCHAQASAGCARGPLLSRRPVRRLVGATLRVGTAPLRAVARARFVPSRRFGCGG